MHFNPVEALERWSPGSSARRDLESFLGEIKRLAAEVSELKKTLEAARGFCSKAKSTIDEIAKAPSESSEISGRFLEEWAEACAAKKREEDPSSTTMGWIADRLGFEFVGIE